MKNTIHIFGSGFSGLTAAYFQLKAGNRVVVYEKSEMLGGKLQSERSEFGLVESGANAILNSRVLEDLAKDIGLPLLPANQTAKRRYIFRIRPKQWPLTIFESLELFFRASFSFLRGSIRPISANSESVMMWGNRVLGRAATEFLVAPALAGIYAGDIAKMDARLVIGPFFDRKRRSKSRPYSYSGSVAPMNGMLELLERLKKYLVENGVEFQFNSSFDLETIPKGEQAIVATGLQEAKEILSNLDSGFLDYFQRIETLPLVSVTCFFERSEKDLRGYGCLFSPSENMNFLGSLFNDQIFENRSEEYRSETWIGGGAKSTKLLDVSDRELLNRIREDRERIGIGWSEPKATYIRRWSDALPHFTSSLRVFIESDLHSKLEERGIVLHGNYMGRIGLSSILDRSKFLAERYSS